MRASVVRGLGPAVACTWMTEAPSALIERAGVVETRDQWLDRTFIRRPSWALLI